MNKNEIIGIMGEDDYGIVNKAETKIYLENNLIYSTIMILD